MVENPDYWALQYADLGVYSVTFHFEAAKDPIATARNIRSNKSKVGLAVSPDTDIGECVHVLPEVDMLQVMTVYPGFGGQKLIRRVLDKFSRITRSEFENLSFSVDGGVTLGNISEIASVGVDTFVAGSSVFYLNYLPIASSPSGNLPKWLIKDSRDTCLFEAIRSGHPIGLQYIISARQSQCLDYLFYFLCIIFCCNQKRIGRIYNNYVFCAYHRDYSVGLTYNYPCG